MRSSEATGSHVFDRVGVVVPAHNEEAWLAGCLTAMRCATAECDVPVDVLVVVDACTDATAEVAATAAVRVLRVAECNVGAARRAGFTALLGRLGADRLWLATTDADTQVPRSWLTAQLAHARSGVDAVVGTVTVTDWSEHPPGARDLFLRNHHWVTGHPHVHGANLGMSAHSYLAADGFPALPAHEDVALVAALKHTGHRVLHTADPTVITSARRHARAAHGFADYLNQLGDAEHAHRPGLVRTAVLSGTDLPDTPPRGE